MLDLRALELLAAGKREGISRSTGMADSLLCSAAALQPQL